MFDEIASNRVTPVARVNTPEPAQPNIASGALWTLQHNLGWLVLSGILGVGVALLATSLATPRYNAHAELFFDPRDLHIFENDVAPTSSPSDTGIALVESQARVLGSDNVLRRVIDKLQLANDPEFNGEPHGPLAVLLAPIAGLTASLSGQDSALSPAETALQTLSRLTVVHRPERTYVLEVTAGAESREKAVAITQAMIDAYLTDINAARQKATEAAGASIASRLESLRQTVDQSEAKVAKYKADHNLVGAGGMLVNEQQLTDINKQLADAEAETNRAKSRYEEMQGSLSDPASSPEAVNSATLRNLKAQLSTIAAQQKQLGVDLLPNHPSMKQLAAQAQTVRNQMTVELRNLQEAARHDYERAKASEQALTKLVQDLRRQAVVSNESQIGLRELQRELDANQSIYQAAILREREAKEQEGINTANVRVISPAIADRDRTFPPAKRVVLPAGFAGGFGLAWIALSLWGRPKRRAGTSTGPA